MCRIVRKTARVFGYPGTRSGTKAAFPKVRLVLLIEAGTHLIVDAAIIVSLPNGRACPCTKTVTLGYIGNVANVGQRVAFLQNG